MVSFSFSQTTLTQVNNYPKLLKQGNTTLVCFTIDQSKQMSKEISERQDCLDLVTQYEQKDSINAQKLTAQQIIINARQKEIDEYKAEKANYNIMLNNKTEEVTNLNTIIKDKNKQILKLRVATIGGFSLAVAIPVLIIILAKH